MNRRDLLLNEMNISQWELAKPQVLKGDAQIQLSPQTKLVVVCEDDHQQSRLFQDILLSLNLAENEYQWLDSEQSLRLTCEHEIFLWLIEETEQADRLSEKFAKKCSKVTAWQNDSWQDLANLNHKRQLWQQIEPFYQQKEIL